jgi:hypothetical protein
VKRTGTAADRLSQQDISSLFPAEGCGGLQQRVEPAAEAAAGDLFDGEIVGPFERGVDEAAGLIVGDQADPEAATRRWGCHWAGTSCTPLAGLGRVGSPERNPCLMRNRSMAIVVAIFQSGK